MTQQPRPRATIDEIISQLEVPIENRRSIRQIAVHCGVTKRVVEGVAANPSKYLGIAEPDYRPIVLEDPRPCPDCNRSVRLWGPWPGESLAPRCWLCHVRMFKTKR